MIQLAIAQISLNKLHFDPAPNIKTKIPGPRGKALLEAQARLEGRVFKYPRMLPLALDEGMGATIRDVDGNTFIDLYAGIGVMNVGHSNPVVLEAAMKQAAKLTHALDFPTQARIELVKRLIEIAPGSMRGTAKTVFGGPTGADAVEGAIKLAKNFTKRHTLIGFRGSYHGQSSAALSVTGGKAYRERYAPLLPDVHFMPYPYEYRCPFGESKKHDCAAHTLQYIADALRDPYGGISKPCAMIVEPIQGESGVIVPPLHFLKGLKKICEQNEMLLIADEIQTGFGRTGAMFASEHYDTTPDVITMAKALGGMGFPLSGCLYQKEYDTWEPGSHMGTFRGNAVGMAAGSAAIDFLRDYELCKHSATLGDEAINRLKALQDEIPQLGEVRGKGLFIGLEFVTDRKTREPNAKIVQEIQKRCLENGVLVWSAGHYGNVVRLIPPLVITQELLHKGLDILEAAIRKATSN